MTNTLIMIAIAKIGGHQALVKIGEQIEVDKIDAEVGKTVSFDALLISEEDGSGCEIGTPFIEGKKVEAKIIEHGRSAKVLVFKMKPRKRYRRNRGHKQDFTLIEITKIGSGTPVKKVVEKAPEEKKDSVKKVVEEKKVSTKKPTAKKVAPKKAK